MSWEHWGPRAPWGRAGAPRPPSVGLWLQQRGRCGIWAQGGLFFISAVLDLGLGWFLCSEEVRDNFI